MRIAFDLQGIQSEGSRARGIGRYSISIIKNIIQYAPNNDYVLVANAALEDIRTEFRDQIEYQNVSYFKWFAPCPLDYLSANEINNVLGIYLRSYAFAGLHADIIFMSSYLEGFNDNSLIELDDEICNSKVVSIFYDLIPLIHPNLYLENNPRFEKFYKSKLENVKLIDGLFAISSSAANEVINHLDVDSKKVFNISSSCDKKLFNLSTGNNYSNSFTLEMISPYILYTGAQDPRKNVRNLLHAYSQLSQELKNYKLVFAGKLLKPEEDLLDSWVQELRINERNIVKLGYISDEDLVILYRNCSLFVFPSLHEGFGLPVFEAMCCGAPVIGSNCTSIPEVLGYEKAMFDPKNIMSIKCLIEKSLLDTNFKNDLINNAKLQSQKFSWSKSASLAIQACEKISNNTEGFTGTLGWRELTKKKSTDS